MTPLSFHLLKHTVDTQSPAGSQVLKSDFPTNLTVNKMRFRARVVSTVQVIHISLEKKLLQLHPHFHSQAAEHKHVSM